MPKIHWQYYFARKFSLQRFEVVLNVFISDYWKKYFKVNVQNILIKPGQGTNHEIWMDKNEWPKAQKKVFNKVYRNLKTWNHYKKTIKTTQKRFVKESKKISTQINKKITNQKLVQLHRRFVFWHQEHFNKPIWIPFATEPLLSQAAQEALQKVLKRHHQEQNYARWIEVVFSPEEKNAITKAREALLEIALQTRQERLSIKAQNKALQQLVLRFGWIPCYDVIDQPWDIKHFKDELKKTLKEGKQKILDEFNQLRYGFQKRKKAFRQFLKRFSLSKREKELFIMAHDIVFIKDERDDFRRQGSFLAKPLFAEIGRRLNLTLKEAAYLSTEETTQRLLTNKWPTNKQVKQRVKGYMILRKFGKPLIFASGAKMKTLLKKELGQIGQAETTQLHGLSGAAGKIKGSVAIVYTKHDLRKVQYGNILVAITTNPDYVPAMRICKAIVTDEGGITSHAAIVSRELKIPCVVGTKIATQVLKDGDLVEVDANKGIVKIINKRQFYENTEMPQNIKTELPNHP